MSMVLIITRSSGGSGEARRVWNSLPAYPHALGDTARQDVCMLFGYQLKEERKPQSAQVVITASRSRL